MRFEESERGIPRASGVCRVRWWRTRVHEQLWRRPVCQLVRPAHPYPCRGRLLFRQAELTSQAGNWATSPGARRIRQTRGVHALSSTPSTRPSQSSQLKRTKGRTSSDGRGQAREEHDDRVRGQQGDKAVRGQEGGPSSYARAAEGRQAQQLADAASCPHTSGMQWHCGHGVSSTTTKWVPLCVG